MKKKTKKLVLAKETVRDLSRDEMGRAAGGTVPTVMCWSHPDYSCQDEFNPANGGG